YWSGWRYVDFVRVITPERSTNGQVVSGYFSIIPTTEANHQVLSCRFILVRADDGSATWTLEFTWTTPAAATQSSSGWQYKLLAQKQAGAHTSLSVTVILPKGAHFTATPTLLKETSATQASSQHALTKDLDFAVQYAL
ncbi:MAG TPA: hypothetical protein VKQ36_16040, partial [Ktedonobacterales bacterium]|nr:hypothetical protein [Ktedonobacterales bacterium]